MQDSIDEWEPVRKDAVDQGSSLSYSLLRQVKETLNTLALKTTIH